MTGDEIRQWRRDHGWSRAELARQLPVAYRTLEDWEAGKADPPQYLWRALKQLEAS